jgi:hypothetical protein
MNYCQKIANICEKRIKENVIKTKINGKIESHNLYKTNEITIRKWFKRESKQEIHPELFPVELYKLNNDYIADKDFKDLHLEKFHPIKLKYIPLLIYDDLLECMLSNLTIFEENDDPKLNDPSFLVDNNIIVMRESDDYDLNKKRFTWLTTFDDVEIKPLIFTAKEKIKKWILEHPEKYY